jgi:UMF1 family MFS transporter
MWGGVIRRPVVAWALYDWANSAYATTVMAGFFPLFFKEYWAAGMPVTDSTFYLGLANSLASLIIVLCAPVLGAFADRSCARKRFLAAFTALGVVGTTGFFFITRGRFELAMGLYVLSTIGFAASLIFYDSLIIGLARREKLDSVSALGFALGYLGGGLLFALNVGMALFPAAFGFADAAEGVRASFVTVALWWALFSIPLFRWVREPPPLGTPVHGLGAVRAGFRQLRATFTHLRLLRTAFTFLLAYWCYIDAVDTIVRMAVDYGLALGFPSRSLIVALLMVQFIGFPAAIAFGRLGERLGPKSGIYLAIAVYVGVVLFASQMTSVTEFYGLAVAIGLVQGGVQSLSRSLYARLVPPDKSAEFFGFFNMLGKFAAVLGPVLVGFMSLQSGNPRSSLLVLLVLFAVGVILLRRVDVAEGERAARAFSGR